jgi:small conductance mechanosensitive channel
MAFDPNSFNVVPSLSSWIGAHGARVVVILAVAAVLDSVLRAALKQRLAFPVNQKFRDTLAARIGPDQKKRINTVVGAIGGMLTFLIYIIAILMVLPEFGVNIAPILAGLGLAGLAVGMAAKDVLADFMAGFFIIIEGEYNIGDRIEIAGVAGTVVEITLRRTVLEGAAGEIDIVPNREVKSIKRFAGGK